MQSNPPSRVFSEAVGVLGYTQTKERSLSNDRFWNNSLGALGSENKDRTVRVTILRMVFLPAFTLSILNLLLSAFPTQAKLFALCTFAEIKSEKTSQNVTAQPALKFTGELPSSRNLSHTCLVETNDTTRLMYLRAKKNEWSIEGEAKISFLSQKQRKTLVCFNFKLATLSSQESQSAVTRCRLRSEFSSLVRILQMAFAFS